MQDELKFEDLPRAISEMRAELNYIVKFVKKQDDSEKAKDEERWLSIEELCDYMPGKPKRATVYGWVHRRAIPYKKFGKRLSFLKSQIDSHLQSHSYQTVDDIKENASSYFNKNKNR